MARHSYESGGKRFAIEVIEVPTEIDGEHVVLYVARVTRVDTASPLCVVRHPSGAPEIYGPSEEWARLNACALIDSGAWREDQPAAA